MHTAISAIRTIVKHQFSEESTGHDWHHIERVTQLALRIGKQEGGDLTVIELAGLLHDISDHKFNGGDFSKGGQEAARILQENDVEQSIIDKVIHVVNNISYKGARVKNTMESLEGKIVQDADRLDAIGAIGIARTFAYGGHKGHPIYSPSIPPTLHSTPEEYQKITHTINHFHEKLLLLKDRMHTETGRKIAEARHQFMETFLNRFHDEWNAVDSAAE
jgi:uncharacterized protein